jgi:hypothetical protein
MAQTDCLRTRASGVWRSGCQSSFPDDLEALSATNDEVLEVEESIEYNNVRTYLIQVLREDIPCEE